MTSFNFKKTSDILCCPHLVNDMQITSGLLLVPRKCDSKFEPATAMTLERVTALAPDVDISNFPGGKLFFRNWQGTLIYSKIPFIVFDTTITVVSYWDRNKSAVIVERKIANTISWMKIFKFWFKFHTEMCSYCQINDMPYFAQTTSLRWTGDKSLSEKPTMTLRKLLCVTRPDELFWVATPNAVQFEFSWGVVVPH